MLDFERLTAIERPSAFPFYAVPSGQEFNRIQPKAGSKRKSSRNRRTGWTHFQTEKRSALGIVRRSVCSPALTCLPDDIIRNRSFWEKKPIKNTYSVISRNNKSRNL